MKLPGCDLEALGIGAAEIDSLETLRRRDTHTVYRLVLAKGSYILKCFQDAHPGRELAVYDLLNSCRVPTLSVHARSDNAILLEDLGHSPAWRQAQDTDQDTVATGHAIAAWYRQLHTAGYACVGEGRGQAAFLGSWVEEIKIDDLQRVEKTFSFTDEPGWRQALTHLDALKSAYLSLPQTFNYNDFAFENLALSRSSAQPLAAVVYDYDQFYTGLVYSDWRNVIGGLRGAARLGFIEAYGPIRDEEKLYDEPLSLLFGLLVASRRKSLPTWAKPLLDMVRNGELEGMLKRGII